MIYGNAKPYPLQCKNRDPNSVVNREGLNGWSRKALTAL